MSAQVSYSTREAAPSTGPAPAVCWNERLMYSEHPALVEVDPAMAMAGGGMRRNLRASPPKPCCDFAQTKAASGTEQWVCAVGPHTRSSGRKKLSESTAQCRLSHRHERRVSTLTLCVGNLPSTGHNSPKAKVLTLSVSLSQPALCFLLTCQCPRGS